MKLIARICFCAGIGAGALGFGFILVAFMDALAAQRPLLQTVIAPGEVVATRWLDIADPTARVGLSLTIVPRFTTRAISPERDEPVDLYRFALHYRARDGSGELLIDQRVLVDAGQGRALHADFTERLDGRPITVDAVFDAFPVTPSENLRVEAVLLPDRHYSADLQRAELRLFRQPPPATAAIRHGISGLLGGLALLLLGLGAELRQPTVPQRVRTPARVLALRARRAPAYAAAAAPQRQAL